MVEYSIGNFIEGSCYFKIESGKWKDTVFAVSFPKFKSDGNLLFNLLTLNTPNDVDFHKIPASLLDVIKEIIMDYTSLLQEHGNLKLKD